MTAFGRSLIAALLPIALLLLSPLRSTVASEPTPPARNPVAILEAAYRAVRQVDNVAFDVRYEGTGAKAATSPTMAAHVDVWRPPGARHNYLRVEGWRTHRSYPDRGKMRLAAAVNDSRVFAKALLAPVILYRQFHQGGISLLRPTVGRAITFFLGVTSLEGLTVKGLTYIGEETIDGVRCDVVAAPPKAGTRLQVAFGRKDHFIRRYALVDTEGDTPGAVVVRLENFRLGAAPRDPAHYELRPTEGLTIEEYKWLDFGTGDPAPAWSVTLPDGTTRSLADFRGKVLLMDFWASWCVPCRLTIPEVQALFERYHERGLEVIGFQWNDPVDPASFLGPLGATYPTLPGDDVAPAYQIDRVGVPSMFVIDPEGRIADMAIGVLSDEGRDAIQRTIETLLDRLSSTPQERP